jgi:hypothetical protein
MDLLTKESAPSILSVPSASRSQPGPKPPQSIPAISRAEGRPAVRSPKDLHLHPALEKVGWVGLIDELNDAAGSAIHRIHNPILIAADGTVLAGFGRWRLAVFEQVPEIYCIEHPLSADDSLAFILTHHQTQRGWNAFVRIRLALTLKSSLQHAALNNMRLGGKYKGLANLPEAQHVDVRQQVADIAGVCPRNVGNVEAILEIAHSTLIEALGNGTLKINRAIQFCKLPRAAQLEQFIRYIEERATNRVIRRSIPQPKEKKASLDVLAVLDALQCQEAQQPGSVAVRVGRHKRTVVLVGQDYLAGPHSQKELKLT